MSSKMYFVLKEIFKMGSILTNSSAISALATLRSIDNQLESTQNRISSGLKVASAMDNAAYWSIATTMRSDSKVMGTVSEALGLSAAQTDTAYTGMNAAIDIVKEINSKLLAGKGQSADTRAKIATEITALKAQLTSITSAASFNSQNWLYNTSNAGLGNRELVGSFNRSSTGIISIGVINVNTTTTNLIDTYTANRGLLTKGVLVQNIPTATGSTATTSAAYFLINAKSTNTATAVGGITPIEIALGPNTSDFQITAMSNVIDSILKQMTQAAANLGAANTSIKKQDEFTKSLKASIDRGIGAMVDADLNEESTKLKALQTQQQLGIQALTIANSQSSNILSLFR